ncbi:hypothetical protein C0991_004601 [Blastosporella zonata]|nr:hypothetical protein C0991_004601 [Blastosporella zonata]
MPSTAPKKIGGEYGQVRANIDVAKLNAYLAQHASVVKAPVDVKQFKSNPTYFLTDASGTKYVLRKKPAGQLLSKTAHQVEREYTMLHALHAFNLRSTTSAQRRVPVPQPLLLCEDTSVIGTPFYIMEFLDGRIFTDTRMLEVSPQDRRECWLSAVATLAALHSIPPDTIGLSKFGPSTDYFPRQIKSLSRVSSAQAAVEDIESGKAIGNLPFFDELVGWYQKNLPDEKKTGLRIVHGDYKLDNLVFHPIKNHVIGILDWEMCTLGSPLADLGNMTLPWSVDMENIPKNIPFTLRGYKGAATDAPVPVEDLEMEYCRLTTQPYPIPEMIFVRSWTLFKLCVISQGIAARYARRQASSEHAYMHVAGFPVVGNLAKIALEDEGITFAPRGSKLQAMPVNSLTTETSLKVAPVLLETLVKHYLDRHKKTIDGTPVTPLRQDELMYDEIFNVVRTFLRTASFHTVEDVQGFANTRTPSPPSVHVVRLLIPMASCDEAAKILVTAFGGAEAAKRIVGGVKWWQVRGISGYARLHRSRFSAYSLVLSRVDAQWITAKKDWENAKRRMKMQEKAKEPEPVDPSTEKGPDCGIYEKHMDAMRCILYSHGGEYMLCADLLSIFSNA